MHYICTGECGGVSESPGICKATECGKLGQPLEPCQCLDGNHHGAHNGAPDEEEADG